MAKNFAEQKLIKFYLKFGKKLATKNSSDKGPRL